MANVKKASGPADSVILDKKLINFIGWSPRMYKKAGFVIEAITFRCQGPAKGRDSETMPERIISIESGGYCIDLNVFGRHYEGVRTIAIEGYQAIARLRGPIIKALPKNWTTTLQRVFLVHEASDRAVELMVVNRKGSVKYPQQIQVTKVDGRPVKRKQVPWLCKIFMGGTNKEPLFLATCRYEKGNSKKAVATICDAMDRALELG